MYKIFGSVVPLDYIFHKKSLIRNSTLKSPKIKQFQYWGNKTIKNYYVDIGNPLHCFTFTCFLFCINYLEFTWKFLELEPREGQWDKLINL